MISNSRPLYVQIAMLMRENIANGIWGFGFKIPSEQELSELYHVSRTTIRKALKELEDDNLIQRKPAIGTFVSNEYEQLKSIQTFIGQNNNIIIEKGLKRDTEYLTIETIYSNSEISSSLKIPLGTEVYLLKRVKKSNFITYAYFETYFNSNTKLSLNPKDYSQSFYQYLSTKKIYPIIKEEYLEAVLANHDLANIMKVKINSALMKRVRFSIYKDFKEYTICYYSGNDYRYHIIK